MKKSFKILFLLFLSFFCKAALATPVDSLVIKGQVVNNQTVKIKAANFLKQELQVYLSTLKSPNTVLTTFYGEPLRGGNNYISVAQVLSDYQKLTGSKSIGNYDLDIWIRESLLQEMRNNNVAFPQLYVSQILLSQSNNLPLKNSEFWNSFSPSQQDSVLKFVSVSRFYSPKNEDLGGRPNNYYGVALLMAATNYKLGIEKDRGTIDFLFQKCFDVLSKSNGFMDDSKKFTGAFDRYNHEFLRFMWQASVLLQDKQLQIKLKPLIIQSAQLWWDLFSVDLANSSLWGRSRQNSWDDTFEQTAFFAENPDLSPASKAQLASAFILAYNYYLKNEYNFKTHLNRMLDFGRGTYSYAGRDRIFGYTLGTFRKMATCSQDLTAALEHSKISQINTQLTLPDVSRFQYFRQGERVYGVWAYRKNNKSFVLPLVGNGMVSDYVPSIYGIPGIEASVDTKTSNMVPILELENGMLLSTAQGADQVSLPFGSNKIELVWNRLSNFKGDYNLSAVSAKASWQLSDTLITYHLEFTPKEAVKLKSFTFAVPVSYSGYNLQENKFYSDSDHLIINYTSDLPLNKSIQATQNLEIGKGAFHPIPFVFNIKGQDLLMEKGRTYNFTLTLKTN